MLSRIGRFEVQAEVGQGGFGQVFRAFDPKVGRVVAIKVLTSVGDPSSFNRFRNEATAAGNLHHRNIVTIHEFGEQDQVPYLVMEYLEGRDLQKLLKSRTPISLLQKLDIMTQVAEGLHYAHRSGVLHRDVKPANLMVLSDGSVKIMDFGIARLVRENQTRLTQEGFLIGTVLYMAPELLTGSDVDVLCDIWAYGVIYYELLCGKNPFATGNQHADMYAIVNHDPAALTLPSDLCPDSLQPVLKRLLTKEREMRYQSLEDVVFDTQPILIDLRRKEADALLPQARGYCEQGQWDEALKTIRSILELDAQHTGARLLRERVQYELHRRSLRPRVEDFIKRGEVEAGKRNYTEAIELYDSARKLDSTDQKIQERIEQLRSAKQRTDRCRQLVAQAQKELESKALTGAFECASEALRVDPDNRDAARLFDEIQSELQARERERRFQDDIQRASGLCAIEAFDEAIALLSDLGPDYANRPEVKTLVARATQLRSEKERLRRFAAALESVRESLRQNKIGQAVKFLERLVAAFPDKAEASDLLSYARQELKTRERKEAIEQLSATGTALAHERKYDQALELIQQQLHLYPDEVVLTRLLRSILASKKEYEREQELQAGLRQCRDLRSQGQWQEALRVVTSLLGEHAKDPELLEQHRQLKSERERFERAAAIRTILDRAESLLKQGRPDSAAELLRAAIKDYPDDSEMPGLLKRAEASKKTLDRQRAISAQIAVAAEYERRGDLAAGLDVIRKTLQQYPETAELSDVERRIEAEIARLERERNLKSEIAAIERDLDAGNWQTASERIQKARQQYPQEPAFARLWDAAQQHKRGAIETFVSEGRQNLAAGRLEDAERLIHTVLMPHRQDPAVASFGKAVQLEKARREEEQRLEEEKRNYLASQLAAVTACESRRDFAAALELIRKASQRYPGDQQLGETQRRVEQVLRRQHDEAIGAAVTTIEQDLARGDWTKAIEHALKGRDQFPEEPAFAQLWNAALQKKRATIENLVKQGRQDLAGSRLEEAERLIETVLMPYRQEPAVKSFAEEVKVERVRRDEEQCRQDEKRDYVLAQLSAAAKCETRQDWKAALDPIFKALQRYPSDAQLGQARTRIEQAIKAEWEQNIAAAVTSIEQELARGEWAKAIEQARSAREQFPDEAVFGTLLTQAQEQNRKQINNEVARVRDLLRAGNVDQAQSAYRASLQQYSQESAVKAVVREIEVERSRLAEIQKAEQQKEAFIASQLKQVAAYEQRHDYSNAIKTVRRARQNYPRAVELNEKLLMLEKAAAAAAEAARQSKYQKGRTEAEALLRNQKFEAAIRCYKRLLIEFPERTELERDLAAASSARDRHEAVKREAKAIDFIVRKPRFWAIAGTGVGAIVAVTICLMWASKTAPNPQPKVVELGPPMRGNPPKPTDTPTPDTRPKTSAVSPTRTTEDQNNLDTAAREAKRLKEQQKRDAAAREARRIKEQQDKELTARKQKQIEDQKSQEAVAREAKRLKDQQEQETAARKQKEIEEQKKQEAAARDTKRIELEANERVQRATYSGKKSGYVQCQFEESNVCEIRNSPKLPGVAVTFDPPKDAVIKEEPSWSNEWRGLTVVRTNPAVSDILLHWRVKR